MNSDEFGVSFMNDAHLNYSVIASITDFSGLGKGQIKKDYQKFIFNGRTGFHEVFKIFGGSGISIEQRGSIFNDSILLNNDINSKPYNPKVLALCFEFGIGIAFDTNSLFFQQEKMQQLVRLLLSMEQKESPVDFPPHIDKELFVEFVRENGITSRNIIRYIHFLQNFTR
mgnify:FL=1|tara:strand:+ start:110 stop:619 length:510 start_codon:yes stop_codon:yes gene_type:complete